MPDPNFVEDTTQAVDDASATSTEETTETAETTDASAASDESTESTESTETTVDTQGSEPTEDSKAVKELKAQRRKRQEAERQAEYWQAVAEGRLPKPEAKPIDQPKPGAPVVTDFANYEDYLVAKAKYELRAENEQTQATTQLQQIHNNFIEKLNDEVNTNPDSEIIEMATDLGTKVTPQLGWIIKESDAPVGVVQYLYEHPAEVNKLNRMSPTAAAREIGRIESKILNPPKVETKKVSTAPAPVKPVKATGPVEFDEESCSMEEFHKRRNQERGAVTRR